MKLGAQRAWCLYDWGNSAFATVCMAAVLPAYLAGIVNRELGAPAGTVVWGWTAALGLLIGAVLGPPLGAHADRRGTRRAMLAFFAGLGAAATAMLAVALPEHWRWAAALYVLGATGFTAANVFYDALLPSLARPEGWDDLSARGFAWGYAGGGLVLALTAMLALGIGDVGVRAGFVLVAVWWAVFTIPVVTQVPEPAAEPGMGSWQRLRRTLSEARSRPALWRFLLAYWIYNDGIGTVIKMAGAYGAEIGVPLAHMIGALLLTQLIGVPATLLFGRLAGRIGPRAGIQVALSGYVVVSFTAFFISTAWHFWVLAGLVGCVQGGAQALSRSLYARLVPARREAEFFSFFDISGRMAGVAGPALFAFVAQLTGSSRASIPVILLFFVLGAWLLRRVDIADTIAT